METRVEFPSDGETLVGTLFRPEELEGPLPTVLAAGGWCYTKEIVLPHVARIVNESGVQVLTFDYAGFGESTGKRRQHLDPWQQISDDENALTYVEKRDDIDAERLGAFGISYSGGPGIDAADASAQAALFAGMGTACKRLPARRP